MHGRRNILSRLVPREAIRIYTDVLYCKETKRNLYSSSFNSLPNAKILGRSKLKAFPDDTINVTQKFKFILGGIENIVGKGENAGSPAFFSFPTMFSKDFSTRVVKSRDCVVKSSVRPSPLWDADVSSYVGLVKITLENRRSLVQSPARPIFFPRTHDSQCDRIHSSLIAVLCFDNAYVGKQPVAW